MTGILKHQGLSCNRTIQQYIIAILKKSFCKKIWNYINSFTNNKLVYITLFCFFFNEFNKW